MWLVGQERKEECMHLLIISVKLGLKRGRRIYGRGEQ